MADNKNNKYKLNVYNTLTKKYEEVEVSEELYNVYRRTGWKIKNSDKRYFDHEIQMSSLIGGDNGAYENFREFIDTENTPENVVLDMLQNEKMIKALSKLNKSERELIELIYFEGMSERKAAEKLGVYHNAVHKQKLKILKKLKKLM